MTRREPPFAAATLLPALLLVAAALFGGPFVLAALASVTLLRLVLDGIFTTAGGDVERGAAYAAADGLSLGLALLHLPLLATGIAAVAGLTGLGFWEGLGTLAAFGIYFGQVSAQNAQNLMRSAAPLRRAAGLAVLDSLFAGHRSITIPGIHERHVGTADDPMSAAKGEGLYAFAVRALPGAFVAGWEIELARAALEDRRLPWWRHPYAMHAAASAAVLAMAAVAFGASGMIALLLLAAWAQASLLVQDYVQHYGLRRRRLSDDVVEPVSAWHSWNSAALFGSALTLNATRHSAQHADPAQPFAERWLPTNTQAPRLPHGPWLMALIALVPPLWRRTMDARVAAWQDRIDAGEIATATPPPAEGPPKPTASPPTAEPASHAPRSATPAAPAAIDIAGAAAIPRRDPAAEEALLARLMALDASEPSPPPPPVQPHAVATAGPTARSAMLWSEHDDAAGPEAAVEAQAAGSASEPQPPRFVRSAALFETEDDAPLPAEAAPPPPASNPAPPPPPAPAAPLESTVANLVAGSRKELRRRRAIFPELEPAEEGEDQPRSADTARAMLDSARLALRALAAVLRGAPSSLVTGDE